jgi:hypothetical protein
MFNRGFAAAQCGKAMPFRSNSDLIMRLRLMIEAKPRNQFFRLHGKAEPYRTVRRQSRLTLTIRCNHDASFRVYLTDVRRLETP